MKHFLLTAAFVNVSTAVICSLTKQCYEESSSHSLALHECQLCSFDVPKTNNDASFPKKRKCLVGTTSVLQTTRFPIKFVQVRCIRAKLAAFDFQEVTLLSMLRSPQASGPRESKLGSFLRCYCSEKAPITTHNKTTKRCKGAKIR